MFVRNKLLIQKAVFRVGTSSIEKEDLDFKRAVAKRAAGYLSKIPFILFVGISGSLAMNNAKPQSDIDLFIITQKNTLWISRFFSLVLLSLNHFSLRRAHNKNERNKICLNLWIDQNALTMPDMPQNAYTAHEIAQVVPLYNKMGTYSQWISKNDWVNGYWPHAISLSPNTLRKSSSSTSRILVFLNTVFYVIQRMYMHGKITREKVTIHYAYFHPFDWGEVVMKELKKKGIVEA